MDPTSRGPEEHGQDGRSPHIPATPAHPARPHRDSSPNSASRGYPTTPEYGTAAPVRTVQVTSGDYLLTVNPVDGSEIEPCPPGVQPARPQRYEADERAARAGASVPPPPPGLAVVRPPLLERQEVRERLTRLLARGRSVRLTGPAGSGRTALLDAVAEDCADLAPDAVVRLSGHCRTPAELLHELYEAVYASPGHRPDESQLRGHTHDIGAVVVLDDLEFGGAALQDFLDAAPECAFLLAATPVVAAPAADSRLEEVFLGGLDRAAGRKLLELATGRPLGDEEEALAGDLWFESEGLPLRFMQAGALLRQRDQLLADAADAEGGPEEVEPVPLPSLAEAAAPAALLASRLSESARAALEFAVALGGEVPHQAHLPALVGDTHADAALGELAAVGLVGPTGARHRLAAGVLTQLEAAGYGDAAPARAHAAAQHYAWWAGHPSVTAERVTAESDALLAALTALVPGTEPGHLGSAVLLARTASPALAAGLAWGAWERVLRVGQEAARLAGEVAEEAYFHHELGVLALLGGRLDRARSELEASIGMRGALADKRGTVAGRRALALVSDRDGTTPPTGLPVSRREGPASPPRGVAAALPSPGFEPDEIQTVLSRTAPEPREEGTRRVAVAGTRRNLAAAGAGALLAAVLGTVVTLGAISDDEQPAESVRPDRTTGQQDELPAERPESDDPSSGPAVPSAPSSSGTPSSGAPSDSPSGSESPDPSGSPSDEPSTSRPPSSSEPPTSSKPPSSSKPPTTSKPPTSEPPPSSPDPDPTSSAPDSSEPASSAAGSPSSEGSSTDPADPTASEGSVA
ncbi:MalT transcriptional regulator family protein [Streptomyces cavernicola]|uniref:ATP-binding protein n=1 Tax=Streptomyces cavernicola TaxID=3043613 RepID=A0ABT6S8S3_9ACTN|nr:ATP-binding protein [Streptomyces sp. B-S-A6]MDI3404502.1 ATP-binding protein [Streptomyces sp. B-S-A6]